MDFDTYAIGGTAPERTVDYEGHKHILALDDSLGPIELGDGATVLRRHLLEELALFDLGIERGVDAATHEDRFELAYAERGGGRADR